MTEASGLPSIASTGANRKVFLSVQKHSLLETSIWTWIIRS